MRLVFFSLFLVFICCVVGCGPKPPGKKSNNSGGTTSGPTSGGTGTSSTVTPPTSRPHGHSHANKKEERVYVFKYTGKRACRNYEVDLEDMVNELIDLDIPVYEQHRVKDGKSYPEECDSRTDNINIYLIDRSHLQMSESSGGFCECTFNASTKICVPYEYAGQPECM